MTIAADIGAGDDVSITSGGPLTISGNVLSDTDGVGGIGGIYINNTGAGAPTTITGNLLVPSVGGTRLPDIRVTTLGPMTISGNLTNVDGDVYVYNNGTGAGNFTTISGNVTGGDCVDIYNGAEHQPVPADHQRQRVGCRRRVHRQLRFGAGQPDDDQRQRDVGRR